VPPGDHETPSRCIRYGFRDTPIGVVLLAATDRGLCSLRICPEAEPRKALAELRTEFPKAALVEDRDAVRAYADSLVAFLEARAERFAPPLDVLSGTPFQREVWNELQRVPPGETISYTALAARIGRPTAIRAVGGACARNGIAIAIPCHRAVRADATLAGYRWGLGWKRRLLEIEAALAGSR
jgi:O-6-methylguanine DNA methyltransferase